MNEYILDITKLYSTKEYYFLINEKKKLLYRIENKTGNDFLSDGEVNFNDPNFYDKNYVLCGDRKLKFDNNEDMITFKLKYL